jgi:tetratricopeptide (TPR) repeat protein
LAQKVDHRADVYALGMVLFEMLAGHSPFEQSASYTPLPLLIEAMALERGRTTPSLRLVRKDVPWSLESITRRCLAPDPNQRYQRAEHLAADLRCFLTDQPLRHAPELSLVERSRKWMRRHPRLSSAASVAGAAAVLLLAAGVALASVRSHLADTRDQLAASQAQDRKRAFEEGVVRAHFLVNTTIELRDHLREGSAVCRQTLNLYGVLERADWQEHPDWRRLAPDDRQRLAEDVRELLLLLAGARVRLAPEDRAAADNALELLDRAEGIPGLPPCRALWEDRAAYRERLGDRAGAEAARAQAQGLRPVGARDHYLLAMTHARAHGYDEAVRHLDRALDLNPRHYWSWVQRGLCHQEQGNYALAASDFGTCVGLWPDFAWGHFNRACALAQCGQHADALADYGRALRLDPELLPAYVNRGLLRLEMGQYGPALADFEEAAKRGRDDAFLHSGRGGALEKLGRHREADEAFRMAAARAASVPKDARLRLIWVYGFAVVDRKPDEARAAFEEVLRQAPANPQALYGCGLLDDRQGRPEEALRYFTLALRASPGFVEPRRFRALAWARRDDFVQARQDVNQCLEREPRSGATLYAAACVTALMAAKEKDPVKARQERDQALWFLREAFANRYDLDKADEDRDLDGVRHLPEFRRLVEDARKRARGPVTR